MKDPTYPLKPIELRITVNGFTWDEVLRALRERVATVEERREQGAGCSASGWGASHTCDIQLRDVSREQFTEESIAWLDAQHAKRRAEAEPEPGNTGQYEYQACGCPVGFPCDCPGTVLPGR